VFIKSPGTCLFTVAETPVKITWTLKMWEACGSQGDTASGFALSWGNRPTDCAFVKGWHMKPQTTNEATASTLTVEHFCKSQLS